MSDSLPTSSPNADPVAAVLRPLLARQLRALRGRYLRHGTALVLAAVVELYRAHSAQLVEPLALDPTFYRGLVQK
ncbi:MAG: hypothetical protein ACK5UQ_24680, partial [Planctomycetota bacterium]